MRSRGPLLFALVGACSLGATGCRTLEPEPPKPPDDLTLFTIANTRETSVDVELRELRADVVGNCSLLSSMNPRLDPARIDPAMFDEGRVVRVAPGQEAIFRHTERAKARLTASPACDVFRVSDGRAIALATPMGNYGTTMTVNAQAFEGSYLVQTSDGTTKPERCDMVKPREVGFSEPIPVGRGMTVRSAERDGDCAVLSIGAGEGKTASEVSFRVCGALGATTDALPMRAGDPIDVSTSGTSVRVVTLEWSHGAESSRLVVATGAIEQSGQALYSRGDSGAGQQDRLQVQATIDATCAPEYGSCGVSTPAQLTFTTGARSIVARAGESMTLGRGGTSTEIVVGAASIGLLTETACDRAPRPRVDFSVLERSRRGAVEVAE